MTTALTFPTPLRVAYVLDPRFPGGTSSAVAAELEAVVALAQIEVHAISTSMFSGRQVAPQLRDVLVRRGLALIWDSTEIAADIVIFHNPSCLKFQDRIDTKIIARHLIVVTHENFLRPGGPPGFDVGKCLSQIAASSIVQRRSLAPISAWNRATVQSWLRDNGEAADWPLLEDDWFNICAFKMKKPTDAPKDRRGRLSRPGFEKFPGPAAMNLCFPHSAERNVILGADNLLLRDDTPTYWMLHPFRGMTVDRFFEQIDFFVYFTAPTWRESFGRVIAEAIAAGKLVITDHETARPFAGGALSATTDEVSDVISAYIRDPDRYTDHVLSAQDKLRPFSASHFQSRFQGIANQIQG